jgi:hypothetical protein
MTVQRRDGETALKGFRGRILRDLGDGGERKVRSQRPKPILMFVLCGMAKATR